MNIAKSSGGKEKAYDVGPSPAAAATTTLVDSTNVRNDQGKPLSSERSAPSQLRLSSNKRVVKNAVLASLRIISSKKRPNMLPQKAHKKQRKTHSYTNDTVSTSRFSKKLAHFKSAASSVLKKRSFKRHPPMTTESIVKHHNNNNSDDEEDSLFEPTHSTFPYRFLQSTEAPRSVAVNNEPTTTLASTTLTVVEPKKDSNEKVLLSSSLNVNEPSILQEGRDDDEHFFSDGVVAGESSPPLFSHSKNEPPTVESKRDDPSFSDTLLSFRLSRNDQLVAVNLKGGTVTAKSVVYQQTQAPTSPDSFLCEPSPSVSDSPLDDFPFQKSIRTRCFRGQKAAPDTLSFSVPSGSSFGLVEGRSLDFCEHTGGYPGSTRCLELSDNIMDGQWMACLVDSNHQPVVLGTFPSQGDLHGLTLSFRHTSSAQSLVDTEDGLVYETHGCFDGSAGGIAHSLSVFAFDGFLDSDHALVQSINVSKAVLGACYKEHEATIAPLVRASAESGAQKLLAVSLFCRLPPYKCRIGRSGDSGHVVALDGKSLVPHMIVPCTALLVLTAPKVLFFSPSFPFDEPSPSPRDGQKLTSDLVALHESFNSPLDRLRMCSHGALSSNDGIDMDRIGRAENLECFGDWSFARDDCSFGSWKSSISGAVNLNRTSLTSPGDQMLSPTMSTKSHSNRTAPLLFPSGGHDSPPAMKKQTSVPNVAKCVNALSPDAVGSSGQLFSHRDVSVQPTTGMECVLSTSSNNGHAVIPAFSASASSSAFPTVKLFTATPKDNHVSVLDGQSKNGLKSGDDELKSNPKDFVSTKKLLGMQQNGHGQLSNESKALVALKGKELTTETLDDIGSSTERCPVAPASSFVPVSKQNMNRPPHEASLSEKFGIIGDAGDPRLKSSTTRTSPVKRASRTRKMLSLSSQDESNGVEGGRDVAGLVIMSEGGHFVPNRWLVRILWIVPFFVLFALYYFGLFEAWTMKG